MRRGGVGEFNAYWNYEREGVFGGRHWLCGVTSSSSIY